MKITIFGARGATGLELTNQALDRNFDVSCMVRNNLPIINPQLNVFKGSINNLMDVELAIKGSEAVISVLGSSPKLFGDKSTDIYSKGASIIVKAMENENVKKLIFCTSAGVEDDPNEIWLYRYVLKPLLLKASYDDMIIAEKTISASSLDWIIVRPSRLINGTATKKFRVSKRFRPEGGSEISRADLAFFMLNQVTDQDWLFQTPTITY